MVIEDSNHQKQVVRANLRAYHKFVTPGSFFLVQDTKLDRFGSGSHGPHGALREFLEAEGKGLFVIDKGREYFLFSRHSNGWLYRKPTGTVAPALLHNQAAFPPSCALGSISALGPSRASPLGLDPMRSLDVPYGEEERARLCKSDDSNLERRCMLGGVDTGFNVPRAAWRMIVANDSLLTVEQVVMGWNRMVLDMGMESKFTWLGA